MRNFISGFMVAIGLLSILHHEYSKCKNYSEPINLEIYTSKEIIYIQGLTVTFETKDKIKVFKDMKTLNNYISTLTSNHTHEYPQTNKKIHSKSYKCRNGGR